MKPAKPPPPLSVSRDPRECRNMANAKSISSSPAPSPQSSPSDPFTVNLPGSASTPYKECSAHPHPQVAPLDRARINRSGRHLIECTQDLATKVAEITAHRDQKEDSRKYKGPGNAGTPDDDPRAVQF